MNSPTPTSIRRYQAYGMQIRSEVVLDELRGFDPSSEAAARMPLLTILNAPVRLPERIAEATGDFIFDAMGSYFMWREVGAFHVSPDGTQIRIRRAEGISDALIAFPLLGPVLSEVLRRRGAFVLHASASEIDGAGVALLADKGTGKSSSAGAMLRGGARLLADDLVALDSETARILPGFPQIKLSEGNLAHQLSGTDWLVRPGVHARIDKVRVRLPDRLTAPETPARRLYLLARGAGEHPEFEAIAPAQRLPALMRFSFAPRFGSEALRGEDAARHFRAAVSLAGKVPMRVLRLPKGLERMDALVEAIREDLCCEGAGG